MPKHKKTLTCSAKRSQIQDEIDGIAWYTKYGMPNQAADERRHLNFLKRQPCK